LHRREDIENIKKLSLELNFEYKEFENMIELEMLDSMVVPSIFATFFSTAIVSLPSFILESKYQVFRIKDENINKDFIPSITNTYSELEKMNLRVELL